MALWGSHRSVVKAFYEDPYWNRIWIAQEFTINPNVQFLIQDVLISSEKVETLFSMMDYRPSHANRTLRQARVVYNIRRAWQTNQHFQLLEILLLTRNSKCGRRHDRIFGLLGLSPEAINYLPEPNYDIAINDATIAITQSYIQKTSADIIFLGNRESTLPSWCPGFFYFDRRTPDARLIKVVQETKTPAWREHAFGSLQPDIKWEATPKTSSDFTFRGPTLMTGARFIGKIRSLGFAWSDEGQSEFPVHDTSWKRPLNSSQIKEEMHACFLPDGTPLKSNRFSIRIIGGPKAILGYSYIKVFTTTHGPEGDQQTVNSNLRRWICRNRRFYTGALFLDQHAEPLKHPMITFTRMAHHIARWTHFQQIAMMDMRLMGFDSVLASQIGWASTRARLGDEIVLIPGCSRPAILRRTASGDHQLVGDAIVSGVMLGELWEKTTAQDLTNICIV